MFQIHLELNAEIFSWKKHVNHLLNILLIKGFWIWKQSLKSYINISNYSSQVGNLRILHNPWSAGLMYFSSLDLTKRFSNNLKTYNKL